MPQISRFANPEKLVSYFGLNPSVYQSGSTPAGHGHIAKRGRSYARAMRVEAARSATQTARPLRALFPRVRNYRSQQITVVAPARKLAAIVWYVLTQHRRGPIQQAHMPLASQSHQQKFA
ncbi:transposase [Burkholderia pseudomultivorans]|uniref:transposase n=1 Tax=Burkholderia pseudomultivorans TaxID=1207504 RepID=UPI001E3097F1|nr:transposase [Burkholderia pseudomultivorans]